MFAVWWRDGPVLQPLPYRRRERRKDSDDGMAMQHLRIHLQQRTTPGRQGQTDPPPGRPGRQFLTPLASCRRTLEFVDRPWQICSSEPVLSWSRSRVSHLESLVSVTVTVFLTRRIKLCSRSFFRIPRVILRAASLEIGIS